MNEHRVSDNCLSVLSTEGNWKDYFDFIWSQPHHSKILNLWITCKYLTLSTAQASDEPARNVYRFTYRLRTLDYVESFFAAFIKHYMPFIVCVYSDTILS